MFVHFCHATASLLDFGLISQNVSKITKKMVLVRPSPAEIVLNHLVGPSEVPGGSASNISIASTFVTARKGGPLRFSMADYSYSSVYATLIYTVYRRLCDYFDRDFN